MLFKIVIALGLLAFSHQSIINLPTKPSLRTAPTNNKPTFNSAPIATQCKLKRINQILKMHRQVNVIQANFETKISQMKNSNNKSNEYNDVTKKILLTYEFQNYLELLLQKYNGQDCNPVQSGLSEIQVSIVNNFANMLNVKKEKEDEHSPIRERKAKEIDTDPSVQEQSEVTNSETPIETISENEASLPTIATENSPTTQLITTPNTINQNFVSETSQSNEVSALTTSTIDSSNLAPESITQINQVVGPSSPTTDSN